MIRCSTLFLVFLALLLPRPAAAQDATGEYSKAMAAYKAYDYETACRKLTNFYAASDSFHQIPAEVTEAAQGTGRSVADLNMDALAAENAREPAKACADRYRAAILLAAKEETLLMEKSLRLARLQYRKMLEDSGPAAHNAPADADIQNGPADSSLAAIVAAAKKANSGEDGGCASDELLHTNPAMLVPQCVNHLLTLARKEKSATQWMLAKLNYQRAVQVNAYLGVQQDVAVKTEAAKAIREIDRALRSER